MRGTGRGAHSARAMDGRRQYRWTRARHLLRYLHAVYAVHTVRNRGRYARAPQQTKTHQLERGRARAGAPRPLESASRETGARSEWRTDAAWHQSGVRFPRRCERWGGQRERRKTRGSSDWRRRGHDDRHGVRAWGWWSRRAG